MKYNFESIENFTTENRRKLRTLIYERLEEYGRASYNSYMAVLHMLAIRFGLELSRYRATGKELDRAIRYLDIILPTHLEVGR